MIPPLGAFLEAHTNFTRARRLDPRRDEARIAEALQRAIELADDRPEDEPAALLFALSRHGRALGAAWEALPLLCARNLARGLLGMELEAWAGDRELEELRLRVAVGSASFEEVRLWVAAHLSSVG